MRRLLIVVDVHNWSWGAMARGIQKYAPADVEVEIVDQTEFSLICRTNPQSLADYSGVCQCSWSEANTGHRLPIRKRSTWLASHGFEFDWPVKDPSNIPSRIATPNRNWPEANRRLPTFDAVLCVSDRIFNSPERLPNFVRVVPGVDTEIFKSSPLPNGEKLVIGWCGQAMGVTKGYHEVLLPLRDRLGDTVEWKINSRGPADALSQQQMADWYKGIDIFLSTSCSEGCQMPMLEAASCGRVLLGTESGNLPEYLQAMELAPGYCTLGQAAQSLEVLSDWISLMPRYRDVLEGRGTSFAGLARREFCWSKRAAEWCEAML